MADIPQEAPAGIDGLRDALACTRTVEQFLHE